MTIDPQAVLAQAHALMPQILDDLGRLVAHPSVAFPGFDPEPVHAARLETIAILKHAGFETAAELDLGGRYPAVWAEIPAPPGRPTVLLYAHYDVQPAPFEQGWTSDPWKLTRKADGRYYGRGAADDKSGIVLHAGMMRLFGGNPPVGIKLIIEGEEETISSLEGYLRANPARFRADAMFIPDEGNLVAGEPVLTTALRGHVQCIIEVKTLQTSLHSGVFGGVAPDALMVLIRMLAQLQDQQGETRVPGLLSSEWPGAQFPEELYRAHSGMLPGVETISAGSVASRLWSKPSVTVIGLDAPPVDTAANILIPSARARVALRIAPGEDPQYALQQLMDYLRSLAPWGAQVQVTPYRAAEAFQTRTDGPVCRAMQRALRLAYGKEPAEVGSGGSIPLLNILAQASPGAEFILYGAEDMAQSRIHGPDESVDPLEIERMLAAQVLALHFLVQ
jgi:acetylornithine deacetylase/succinyl-diaminopimelate desuccinylase-like protein